MINVNDKEEVERALAERKKTAPAKIRNDSLPAGSPMYFYCDMCGHHTVTLPEGFITPPPRYCDFCTAIRKAGWIE